MTPFLQFRVWLRRGPNGERWSAGAATVLMLALLAWIAVPVRDEPSTIAAVGGTGDSGAAASSAGNTAAPGAPGADEATDGTATADVGAGTASPAGGAAGASGQVGAASGEAAGAPAAGGQAPERCSGLTAGDQGVSATEIFVAVPLINLAGGAANETFGVRGDLEAVIQAAAAGVNDEGGVACRKIKAKTYRVNPLDPNEQRARCLEIAGDKPFAVIDVAAYLDPVSRSCFAQNKLPYQGVVALGEDEAARGRPYLYSARASAEQQARNWALETAARGTFDPQKGFKKLGMLLDECNPKANAELRAHLTKVGVRPEQTSTFTMQGCATLSPPSQISQAVVQHRNDGVSHVFLGTAPNNGQPYVRQADGIRWKPVYLVGEYRDGVSTAAVADWADGFDGTVGITSGRDGELNSGIVHPLIGRCQAWLKKKNLAPAKEGDGAAGICDMFRLFAAAANAAGPNVVRTSLLDSGLAKLGRFETGSLGAIGIYDRPGKVWGGDFIRAVQWRVDCRCWKVLDRDLKPGH